MRHEKNWESSECLRDIANKKCASWSLEEGPENRGYLRPVGGAGFVLSTRYSWGRRYRRVERIAESLLACGDVNGGITPYVGHQLTGIRSAEVFPCTVKFGVSHGLTVHEFTWVI